MDRERGTSICVNKYEAEIIEKHFITADLDGLPDFGQDTSDIFVLDGITEVLSATGPSLKIAVQSSGLGHCVYFSGFKYSHVNARLLHRTLYWAAGAESAFTAWTCEACRLDAAYYPGESKVVVINNSDFEIASRIADASNRYFSINLKAHGLTIIDL